MGAQVSAHTSIIPAMRQIGTVERAFQLARSGSCRTLDEIRLVLKREGHDAVEGHLAGSAIRADLRRLCAEATSAAGSDEPAAR